MMTVGSDRSPFRRGVAWRRDHDLFYGDIDETWSQGRSTYGGLVAAGALGAMQTLVDPARPVRSLLVNYVAPVEPGAVVCRVELLRAGRAATQLLARVEQDGAVGLVVNGVFGEERSSPVQVAARAQPALTPVDATADIPFIEELSPRFTRLVRYRWGRGSLPFSGGDSSDIGGHVRFKDAVGEIDARVVVGLLDAWPAPVMSRVLGPVRASSMSWCIDFLQPLPAASADGWWSYAADTRCAADGYAAHEEWLWSPQGQAVAHGSQLVAVFG
jgi:acyl-CoA thioesterase